MSFYQKIADTGSKFISKPKLFKYGFNLSPMYRRSTAKVISVSEDLMDVRIKLPISYRNKNYVNSIFGGSMFSAIDPIPMVQLINLLGKDFVVWDKAAEIFFKRPAKEDLFADFSFNATEVEELKSRALKENEFEFIKKTQLTNKDRSTVFCEVNKTLYVATKSYFKEKRKKKEANGN